MEDSIKGDLNCGSPAQEVSEGRDISKWPKGCSGDILVKNVPAFCLSPKNLPEAKLKSCGLMALAEEISSQPSIDCAVWLLVTLLRRSVKKRSKQAERASLPRPR